MIDIGDNADMIRAVSETSDGFDFGEHGTGLEIAVFCEVSELMRGSLVNGFLVW